MTSEQAKVGELVALASLLIGTICGCSGGGVADSETDAMTSTSSVGTTATGTTELTAGPDTAPETATENSSTDQPTTVSETGPGTVWCADADNDGYGDADTCMDVPPGVDPPTGSVDNADDCDDTNDHTHPGAAEQEPALCANDGDDDGWGDHDPPDGVDPGSDCNDNNSLVYAHCLCEPIVDSEDPICSSPAWDYILFALIDPFTEPMWIYNDNMLCQASNGPPSAFLCDGWELDDDNKAHVTFDVKVDTDNDWIGFVFGWQDWAHFYAFTWKRDSATVQDDNLDCQAIGTFKGGMMVKMIDAPTEQDINCRDMHDDEDTSHSVLLWDPVESPNTNKGWEPGVTYLFDLDMSQDQGFVLTIYDLDANKTVATIASDDTTYPDGHVGVFAASQVASCWSGFSSASCASP